MPADMFAQAQQQWANPAEAVFQLTPPPFDQLATDLFFGQLGHSRADVNSVTFWDLYLELLQAVMDFGELPDVANAPQSAQRMEEAECAGEYDLPLMPNLRPLQHGQEIPGAGGYCYMGGLQDAPALPASIMQVRSQENVEQDDDEDHYLGFGLADNQVYASLD